MMKHLCLVAALCALPLSASADGAVPSLSNAAAFTPKVGPVGRALGRPEARQRTARYDIGCSEILRAGAVAPNCAMGFRPARATGKGTRSKPAILGDLTAFPIGSDDRFAVGLRAPGLIETLRAGRMASSADTGKGSR
ncbi:hypothetical protein [Arenibacterium halophilum]|uniref:Uncharacterized protein n=1 Tax=Arenibacterium halophilum TaxID=2583821 RepID=A0ABY2X6A5_9RHOB|nr:hypothetical protein [Arenibacterium halophilum]TMV11301.1 hypothetical protein FGK64_13485 [Arenibacterium halophilum]